MGDVRFNAPYEFVRDAPDRARAIRDLSDEDVIASLAAASREGEPYLANILATEAQNRMRRASTMTANLGEGVFALDREGRLTFVNPACERLLGWDPKDAREKPVHALLDGEAPEVPSQLLGVIRTGRPVHGAEATFLRHDGTPFPVAFTASPIRRGDEVEGAVVVFRDITEPKRQREALRRSEHRLERLVETLTEGVVVTDAVGRIVFANAAAERILGVRRAGITARRYDAPAWQNKTLEGEPLSTGELPLARALATREAVHHDEHLSVKPNGETIVLRVSASPLLDDAERLVGAVASFEDVTQDRMRRETQARLAALVDSISDAIIGKTLEGTITSWNPAATRLYGYRPEEIIGKPISRIIPPERLAELDWIMARVRRGERVENLQTERMDRNGRRIEVHVSVAPVFDEKGRASGAVASQHDITGRKRLERALQASEARFRRLFEASATGMATLDEGLRVLDANPALSAMLGYAREDLVGHPLTAAVATGVDEADRVRQAASGEIPLYRAETRILTRDGEMLPATLTVTPGEPGSHALALVERADE